MVISHGSCSLWEEYWPMKQRNSERLQVPEPQSFQQVTLSSYHSSVKMWSLISHTIASLKVVRPSLSSVIVHHGRILLYVILIRVINMRLHMLGIRKRWIPFLHSCGQLRPVPARKARSVGLLLHHKTSAEIWQIHAVINSEVGVSWTCAFRSNHQGPGCPAAEDIRSRFPWER